MEDFGEQRAEWFHAQGLFPQGMPSHDTLGRVFRMHGDAAHHLPLAVVADQVLRDQPFVGCEHRRGLGHLPPRGAIVPPDWVRTVAWTRWRNS